MSGSTGPVSRREAVQPSLWDRLVDDLPGLGAEIGAQRARLDADLGAERVARLVAGGPRAIEREEGLDELSRRRLHVLCDRTAQMRHLEEAGIVVTSEVLREAVRRDLEALFNTERLEADFLLTESERQRFEMPSAILSDFPETRRSVLNFGVPSFSGRTRTDFDRDALARELRDILAIYEPRLKRDSIRIKVGFGDRAGMTIDLDAVLMLTPVPERLRLLTTIDLDNGRAQTALEEA